MKGSHVLGFTSGVLFAVVTSLTALRSQGSAIFPGPVHSLTSPFASVSRAASEPPAGCTATLEQLAYTYGTDKSRDDHKYTDLYAMLFEPVRMQVRTVLELGVLRGQSLQMWSECFCDATINGFDIRLPEKVEQTLRRYKNIRTFETDVLKGPEAWRKANFEVRSIDLLIDDAGMHT